MDEPITRVTLFVPGPPKLQACPAVLRAQRHEAHQPPTNVTTEWVDNDGEFGDAFSFGTVSPEGRQAIDDAAGALVLHWPVDLRDGRKEIVAYIEALSYNGAIAVRLEQSRLGWDVSRWLKLFSRDSPGLAPGRRPVPHERGSHPVLRHARLLSAGRAGRAGR